MSGLLAGKVWLSNLPRKLKPLAASLADIANDDGTSIYPSVRYMAWRLSSSIRFVQLSLAELKRLGVLEIVANPKGGRSLTVEYRMVEGKLPARPAWSAWRKSAKPSPIPASSEQEEKDAGSAAKGCLPGQNGCKPQRESMQTSTSDPSVSVSEPSVPAPEEMGRQFTTGVEKQSKRKAFPFPKRPSDPLRRDLFGGIWWKKIENVLLDMRQRPFAEQVYESVRQATTDLFLDRAARMNGIQPSQIEARAFEKLRDHLNSLDAVSDFDARLRLTRDAVGNAVISAAAKLTEGNSAPNGQ